MVLMINGVPLEEAPRDLSSFLSSYPHFKESASRLCTMKAESIGPHGLVYVCAREFAVTHPHDNKISVMGTDDITTSHIIVIKHSGSGALGLTQIDRYFNDDSLTTMIQRIQSLSYHYEGRLQLHLIGGFSDNRRISHNLSIALLQMMHKNRIEMDLETCCIGDLCTLHRNGIAWPIVYGIGVNVKTGDIFPAQFTDKGPDMDIRYARTLTGGDNVGLLEIYDCSREELRIGPFSYEPMRAVDIWLQQSDEFLLQSLSSVPEVVPPHFVQQLRTTLKRIKDDPYPAVTIFNSNCPRYYRKDSNLGHWLRVHHKEENNGPSNTAAIAAAAAGWPPPAAPVPSIANTQAYY